MERLLLMVTIPLKRKSATLNTYKVQVNDNLAAIANKYGVTVEDIKNRNNLNSEYLLAGQNLRIYSNKTITDVKTPVARKQLTTTTKNHTPQTNRTPVLSMALNTIQKILKKQLLPKNQTTVIKLL